MLMNFSIPNALAFIVRLDQALEVFVTTLIFVIMGLVFFTLAYFVLSRIFDIHKEIEEDHNTALGIVIASIIIGISIIVGMAIQG
jgi:uncharacterized membrane protein YjfL (UPF0719 family)